jgi:hypothetical protein
MLLLDIPVISIISVVDKYLLILLELIVFIISFPVNIEKLDGTRVKTYLSHISKYALRAQKA